MKAWLRKGLSTVTYYSGICKALNILNDRYFFQRRNGLFWSIKKRSHGKFLIMNYHRVNDDQDGFSIDSVTSRIFDWHLRYYKANYDVISLEEIVENINSHKPLPGRCMALTFDDGYQDNFTHAYPILKKYGFSSTIFLSTDFIGTGKIPWFDQVLRAFKSTHKRKLTIDGMDFYLDTEKARQQAAFQVLGRMRNLYERDLELYLSTVLLSLEIDLVERDNELMLTWAQVREMSRDGIRFGSHTVTHSILSKVSLERVKREIVESKDKIEKEIRKNVSTLAYPNGQPQDYSTDIIDNVKKAGYSAAVTTIGEPNDYHENLFQLKRFRPWDDDLPSFALRLTATAMREKNNSGDI